MMSTVFGPKPPNRLLYPPKSSNIPNGKHPNDRLPSPIQVYANAVYYPRGHTDRHLLASRLPYDMISHVFYSFACVQEDGSVALSNQSCGKDGDANTALNCLNAVKVLKSRYQYLKVVLSIGGWAGNNDVYAIAAKDSATRTVFAVTAKQLITDYGLNGIDLNWNYPSGFEQLENYVRLLRTLKLHFPSPYFTLTTTFPICDAALANPRLGEVSSLVDIINVMSVDLAYSRSSCSEVATPSYTSLIATGDQPLRTCDHVIEHLIGNGVPAKKILLGIPCDGSSSLSMNGVNQPQTGSGSENGMADCSKVPKAVTEKCTNINADIACRVDEDNESVAIDTPEIVKLKANFIKARELGGLFYWPGLINGQDWHNLIYAGYMNLHFLGSSHNA